MRYCADCGTPHECAGEQARALSDQVEIVRLETQRDIAVARINASAARDIAETEAEQDGVHAEGVAEGMETAIEAITGTGGDPAAPVIVDADPDPVDVDPEPVAPDPATELPVVDVRPPAKRDTAWFANYS